MCLPSDASCSTYSLTWVSFTLDMGYLLTAAPPDLVRGVAPLGSLCSRSHLSLDIRIL